MTDTKLELCVELFYQGKEVDHYEYDDEVFPSLESAMEAADRLFLMVRVATRFKTSLNAHVRNAQGQFERMEPNRFVVLVCSVDDVRSARPFYIRGCWDALRSPQHEDLRASAVNGEVH